MSDQFTFVEDGVIYEYWRDGEMIKKFTNKLSAMRHYNLQCGKAPSSLHTVFMVEPKRTAIIQFIP